MEMEEKRKREIAIWEDHWDNYGFSVDMAFFRLLFFLPPLRVSLSHCFLLFSLFLITSSSLGCGFSYKCFIVVSSMSELIYWGFL